MDLSELLAKFVSVKEEAPGSAEVDDLLKLREETRELYEANKGTLDRAYTDAINAIDLAIAQLKNGPSAGEPGNPLPEPEPVP